MTQADDTAPMNTHPTEDDRREEHDPAGRRPMSTDEIRSAYADMAPWAGRLDALNRVVTGRARARIFREADGSVLDVACGTGTNYRYLEDGVDYTGVDLSPAMLGEAADRFEQLDRGEDLLGMDAADLAFRDDSFDTVISSLSTCTFPEPRVALREMARVCRPDGEIRLLEHGRSSVGPVARFQDWRTDAHYASAGCRWTQQPRDVVESAGLEIESARRGLLGILTAMVVRPDVD